MPFCMGTRAVETMTKPKMTTTKEFSGTRVVGGKKATKRIGKIRRFVFHPSEKRVVGFIVKRPDLLLMFHRKDRFVPLDGIDIEDGQVVLPYKDATAYDEGACKRLGIDYDSCVLWEGMPIMTVGGQEFGVVGNVTFSLGTGDVKSITANRGTTAKALLGQMEIPANSIKGFKTGIGAVIATMGEEGAQEDEDIVRGAILVADDVLEMQTEGGLAEKAGRETAVIQNKAQVAKEKAAPKVHKATKATGDAINKGAYATGRQIAKSKGMFSAFKEEYDKAVTDDDAPVVPAKKKK